jgi:DNA-binding transcriptional LysR family regulator
MDWNDIRFFLALARAGSVRLAGQKLGVSHSTVSRRVEALEQELSARLFDRSRDGYTLTRAGRAMVPRAERMEAEAAGLERELAGRDEKLSGPVRLTCSDATMAHLLVSSLADFFHRHPDLELDVNVDARPFDLSRREADIAIRALGLVRKPPEHLLANRLLPLTLASYVGVAHARRLDPAHAPNDARWLGVIDRKTGDHLVRQSSFPNLPVWGMFSSMEVLASAARAGLGLTILPTYFGDLDPHLQRLSRPDVRHLADIWLVSHPDLRTNARLRAVRDAIRDVMADYTGLFAGDAPTQFTDSAPWFTVAPTGSNSAPNTLPADSVQQL